MGDVPAVDIGRFRTQLENLGPQWTTVEGVPYLCHTRISGCQDRFVATTPFDYRLFEVGLTDQKAEAITHRIPAGNGPLSPDRHIPTQRIIQWAAEAWLVERVRDKGVEFYARYLIPVLVGVQLVSPDRLSQDLVELLGNEVLAHEIRGRISDYSANKAVGLMQAWIEGIIFLASVAVGQCDE